MPLSPTGFWFHNTIFHYPVPLSHSAQLSSKLRTQNLLIPHKPPWCHFKFKSYYSEEKSLPPTPGGSCCGASRSWGSCSSCSGQTWSSPWCWVRSSCFPEFWQEWNTCWQEEFLTSHPGVSWAASWVWALLSWCWGGQGSWNRRIVRKVLRGVMLTVRSAGGTGQLVEQHAGGRCHHRSAFQMRNRQVVEKAVPEPPGIFKWKCKAGGKWKFIPLCAKFVSA